MVLKGGDAIDKQASEPKKAKWIGFRGDNMPYTEPIGHFECENGYYLLLQNNTVYSPYDPPDCIPDGSDPAARGRGSASGVEKSTR